MSTQAERLVRIEKDGVQKAVSEADYKHRKMVVLGGQTYEADGWTVVSFEDGTPYDAGEPATKYGLYAAGRAAPIGVEGTNPTDADGKAVDANYVKSVGASLVADEPTVSTTRSRATTTTATEAPTE